ncbi:uncharacterized protein SCHCODRAFT_02518204 [Schizophyllum commune H4-8]|uniref:DUF6535 domain-containing protein n=1 Tax=Schizophyllum commune (strain H4-8 / FGSC 9210) TaxID=578458 RepID=D8QLQ7_SCHCM|nr:uncharacterized protein SCHCODRAFT_02518204 [Schizophyllum commune H4-8]KAI5886707.1 hypothetical protein SCHCODRAFT_02518204 [Schizophyllum commune H4-8]
MTDVQDPPASGGSKTFGIHKYDPRSCLGEVHRCCLLAFAHRSPVKGAEQSRENGRRGYADKYEDDPLYEELGDEARIWRVMLDEGRIVDAAMLQRFRDHLDVDLVFAGLFSAVLTTFVVQTSQTPSTTGDTTIALLLEIIAIQRAWANDPRVDGVASFSPPPPSPSPSPWINRCWFLSLVFSLLAAFGAVVVRQWLQEYESDIAGPPKRRALVRHFRRVGLENYKVHLIVPILPMLLHVSLLLFFIGLTLYALVMQIRARLPPHFWIFYPAAKMVKRRLEGARAVIWERLQNNWKEIFKTPDAHEWDAVLDSSDALIPNSLDSMVQISSDLSVTPLVVQASSDLPINPARYDNIAFEDPHYAELLRHRILPWFINALSTRRTVFDWAPGRENELQRMACALLLVPLTHSGSGFVMYWKEVDTAQYRACVLRVFESTLSALTDLSSPPMAPNVDVTTMSITLFALSHRLLKFHPNWTLPEDVAVFGTGATVYSSLPKPPSLASLRLRPVLWHEVFLHLRYITMPMDDSPHFAIDLWRSALSEALSPGKDDQLKKRLAESSRVTLQEWLYLGPDLFEDASIIVYHLLCPQSCELHEEDRAEGNAAFDDNLGFLAVHFIGSLLTTLGYDSIDSALRTVGHPAVSAAFKSSFLVRPSLPLAKFVQPWTRLPATFAVLLFWFLAKLALATDNPDEEVTILKVLSCHATDYCEVLAEALDHDEIEVELLLKLVPTVLHDHQLAFLDISDALATSLATKLRKATGSALADVMDDFLYLNALCAARANSKEVDGEFPDASRKLHSVLLSLKPTYSWWCKRKLEGRLKDRDMPLAVALALRSPHGLEALAEIQALAWKFGFQMPLKKARTWIGIATSLAIPTSTSMLGPEAGLCTYPNL